MLSTRAAVRRRRSMTVAVVPDRRACATTGSLAARVSLVGATGTYEARCRHCFDPSLAG